MPENNPAGYLMGAIPDSTEDEVDLLKLDPRFLRMVELVNEQASNPPDVRPLPEQNIDHQVAGEYVYSQNLQPGDVIPPDPKNERDAKFNLALTYPDRFAELIGWTPEEVIAYKQQHGLPMDRPTSRPTTAEVGAVNAELRQQLQPMIPSSSQNKIPAELDPRELAAEFLLNKYGR